MMLPQDDVVHKRPTYMDVSVCTKVYQITEQSLTQAHVTTGGTRAAALRTSVTKIVWRMRCDFITNLMT